MTQSSGILPTGGLIVGLLVLGTFEDPALQKHRRNTRHHAIHKQPPAFFNPDASLAALQKNTQAFYRVHALQSGTRVIAASGFVCLIVAVLLSYNRIVTEFTRWDWVNTLGGFAFLGSSIYSIASVYEWARGRFTSTTQ